MSTGSKAPSTTSLVIKYPVLWLATAAFVVYLPTVFFGITRLDDYVFLVRLQHYNSHLSGLFTSFTRGVFGLNDNYYRPVFLDSLILNSRLLGGSTMSYHIVNVGLHVLAVTLLFRLFLKLNMLQWQAFVVTLLFAVHPVLTQAVAWIPGRNDTLLAVFGFSFLLWTIEYSATHKAGHLAVAILFFLLTLFTKESGVFFAPVAVVLLVGVLRKGIAARTHLLQYVLWLVCGMGWFAMRSASGIKGMGLPPKALAAEFVQKLPLLVQYTGKIFVPVNLSVFPLLRDTDNFWGLLALSALVVSIILVKSKSTRHLFCGVLVFFIFVLPALMVPNYVSPQIFEHRLYLPITGILLLLPQTFFFKNGLPERQLFSGFVGIALVLAVLNFRHQQHFKSPYAFWSQAVASTPSSGYAHIMLGMQEPDKDRSQALFQRALQLAPNEQRIDYSIGITMQKQGDILASEPYLLAEKRRSNFYMCDFYLAKVAFAKGDYAEAQRLYFNFLNRDPNNAPTDRARVINNPAWQQADSVKVLLGRMLNVRNL